MTTTTTAQEKLHNDGNDARPTKPRLEQLDGFRFIVALWLVFAHNYDNRLERGTVYERFCLRRYVAVTFFLVLSGFVSQYAYGTRDFTSKETLRKFYVGRFGSILACYYATNAAAFLIRAIGQQYSTDQWVIGVPLVLTLLQCWIPKYAYIGNTPGWTMSTLAAHWLAFPFLQVRLQKWTDRHVVWLCVAMPIVACVPVSMALAVQGGTLDDLHEWLFYYVFPPFRFPEFVLGAGLAELYVRGHRPKMLARLADLVFPLVFGLVLAVPYESRNMPYDCLLIYLPMSLFGLLVFGSSCDISASWTARLFALEPLRKLGDFAFQVYLWRWPLFATVMRIQDGYWKKGYMYLEPAYFVPSFFVLYIFSYLWYRFVDNPLRLYLSKITAPAVPPTNVLEGDAKSSTVVPQPENNVTEDSPGVTKPGDLEQPYTRMT